MRGESNVLSIDAFSSYQEMVSAVKAHRILFDRPTNEIKLSIHFKSPQSGRSFKHKKRITTCFVYHLTSLRFLIRPRINSRFLLDPYATLPPFDAVIGYEDLAFVDMVSQDTLYAKKAKSFLNRIHKNVWPSLRCAAQDYLAGTIVDVPEFISDSKAKFRNISSYLSDNKKLAIQEAFEKQEDFSFSIGYYKPRAKRFFSVEGYRNGSDEFVTNLVMKDLLDGRYSYAYSLINPTTALTF